MELLGSPQVEGLTLAIDLVVVLGIALVAGLALHLLRQPPIIGYMLAGIAIGPFGLRLVRDVGLVRDMAELGVALLMFAIGVEFSLAQVRRLGKAALMGGVLQMALTAALGLGLASALLFPIQEGIFFGLLIALTSTLVVLKTLMERGEMDALHGRMSAGILIVQDLGVVPILVFLQSLTSPDGSLALGLLLATLKAVLLIGLSLFLGVRLVPWLLARIAAVRSRELFLLAIIALSVGMAFGTASAGLPLALGAFLAGLIVSESELADQALAEVIPLRDIFATIFFASVGMLVDPRFIAPNIGLVLAIVAAVFIGKSLITGGVVWLVGYPGRTALMVGAALVPIGEFTFVLGQAGLEAGVLSERLFSLTLASAVVTIFLTPMALSTANRIWMALYQRPRFSAWLAERYEKPQEDASQILSQHVVICGMGRVGQMLVNALSRRGFSFLVIDMDYSVVSSLRQRGIPAIYGDASNPVVLRHAGLDKARVLALAMPDQMATELAIRHAREINPKLDVIARVQQDTGLEALKALGASEVVQPQHEAGLEIVRHTLRRYGLTGYEIQHLISTLREESQE